MRSEGHLRKKQARAFYKEIGAAVSFFETRYSWDYLCRVKRKKLYWDTMNGMLPPPFYRPPALTKDAHNVFKRIRKLYIPTSTKDLFVRFHCEVLPVKAWLAKKGFFIPWSLNCDLCGSEEDLFHVFLSCKRARDFWDEFRLFTGLDINIDWASLKFLVFDGCEDNDTPGAMVAVGLHALWRFRMDITECKPRPQTPWGNFLDKIEWIRTTISASNSDVYQEDIQKLLERMKTRMAKAQFQPPRIGTKKES